MDWLLKSDIYSVVKTCTVNVKINSLAVGWLLEDPKQTFVIYVKI